MIDRAIQLFGGAGVTDDWPLAEMYAHARTLHLVDGPDEVHMQQIARRELRAVRARSAASTDDGAVRCVAMKVRIGYGLGTQGLADGGARFAELVDALEALRLRLALVSERVSGPIARPDGGARRSRPGARRSSSSARACRCCPGAARRSLAKEWATLDVLSGGRALPAFGLGVVDPVEQQAFGVAREERAPLFDEALAADPPPLERGRRRPRRRRASTTRACRSAPGRCSSRSTCGSAAGRRASCAASASSRDGWLPSFCTPETVAEGRDAASRGRGRGAGRAIDPEHFGAMVFYARDRGARARTPAWSVRRARVRSGRRDRRWASPRCATRLEEFLAVGFSKLVLVPVQEAESWRAEVEELADGLLDLQGTRALDGTR